MSDSVSTSRTKPHERPLSPHLGIYKWQIPMLTSITHRATGVFLSMGLVVFVAWLWIAAYCPESYDAFTACSTSWWGRGLLMAWSLAFFYHFINGIRHLFWDIGDGLEIDAATRSGYIAIFGSLIATAGLWLSLLS